MSVHLLLALSAIVGESRPAVLSQLPAPVAERRLVVDSGQLVQAKLKRGGIVMGRLLTTLVKGDTLAVVLLCDETDGGGKCSTSSGAAVRQLNLSEVRDLWVRGTQSGYLGWLGIYAGALVGAKQDGDEGGPFMALGAVAGASLGAAIGSLFGGWIPLTRCGHHGPCGWSYEKDPASVRDSTSSPRCMHCFGYGALATPVAFIFAPATLIAWPRMNDPHGSWLTPASYVAFRAGGMVAGDTAFSGAHSESLEWLAHGVYSELRVATWYRPQPFMYQTVRVGRLVQRRSVRAGCTLGYQRTPLDRSQEGPELALPLILGGNRFWLRSEASYVVSSERVNMSYRLQGESRIRSWPLHAGFDLEFKSNRETPYASGLSAVMAIRP